MLVQQFAQFLMPGQSGDEYWTQENQIWWGRHDQQVWVQGVIAAAQVDTGNTGYTNILRHGIALGVITASQKFGVWNPYAVDGTHRLVGFLTYNDMLMSQFGVGNTADRQYGMILTGGNIQSGRIIIPGETTAGISGKSYEFLLREQMIGRYRLDDEHLAGFSNWKVRELTASATATTRDNKTHFTNLGAAGSVTLTLPAPIPGLEFLVSVVAAQNIVLNSTATGQFLNGATSVDNDTLTAANRETIRVFVVRTAATPTYQYKMERVPA